MDYNNLTEDEMREMVNRKVTQKYEKLLKDCKQITTSNYHKYGEDLLAYCLEKFLLDKPIKYQFTVAVIDDKLPNYMGRAMSLNLKSSSSPFWAKYRRESYNSRGSYIVEYGDKDKNHKLPIDEFTTVSDDFDVPVHISDPVECISHAVENLDYYHKALVNDYFFNNMTYTQMNKKYGITLISLKKAIDKGKQLIKEQCQHFNL